MNNGKILVVEDRENWQITFQRILTKSGYSLDTVGDYVSAVRKLQETHFDLVILDLRLVDYDEKNVDGMKLLYDIRKFGLNDVTHTIIVTGYGTIEFTREAFAEFNVVDLIDKDSFDRREFLVAVRKGMRAQNKATLEIRQLSPGLGYEVSLDVPRDIEPPLTLISQQSISEEKRTRILWEISNATEAFNRQFGSKGRFKRDAEAPQALKTLETIGKAMHSFFLPPRLQEELSRVFLPITIRTNDRSLPWELLHDGTNFLCLKNSIGRRVEMHSSPRTQFVPKTSNFKFLVIVNPSGDLPAADKEAEFILKCLSDKAEIHIFGANYEDVSSTKLSAALKDNYDVIHYAGHAEFNPQHPDESRLILKHSGGTVLDSLSAGEVNSSITGKPLVFLNACSSAREESIGEITYVSEADLYGLVSACLLGGALGVVGALWPIYDTSAAQLAATFYEHFLTGERIGDALRLARQATKNKYADISWASFVLYGDPLMRVSAFSPIG